MAVSSQGGKAVFSYDTRLALFDKNLHADRKLMIPVLRLHRHYIV